MPQKKSELYCKFIHEVIMINTKSATHRNQEMDHFTVLVCHCQNTQYLISLSLQLFHSLSFLPEQWNCVHTRNMIVIKRMFNLLNSRASTCRSKVKTRWSAKKTLKAICFKHIFTTVKFVSLKHWNTLENVYSLIFLLT